VTYAKDRPVLDPMLGVGEEFHNEMVKITISKLPETTLTRDDRLPETASVWEIHEALWPN